MWIAKAPMGTPRYRLAAVYADQGVYAIGGQVYCTSSPKSDQCFSKYVPLVKNDKAKELRLLLTTQTGSQVPGLNHADCCLIFG